MSCKKPCTKPPPPRTFKLKLKMLFILVILALAIIFYYFLWKPQLYWKSINVKQRSPTPIFGDGFKMAIRQESESEMVRNIYNQFKDARYCGFYQLTIPTLMLRDPDLIKPITIKDFEHFVDHPSLTSDDVDPFWSGNVFALTGDRWKEMRAFVSPAFTLTKIRSMFELMDTTVQQCVDFYVKQNNDVIHVELKDSFTRIANDVIANCFFGIQVDSLKEPENELYMNVKEIADVSIFWKCFKIMLFNIAPKIIKVFKIPYISSCNTAFFRSVVREMIKVREAQNTVPLRQDVINLLIEARKRCLTYEKLTEPVIKTEMTEIDIVSQVILFFFNGSGTTSTMMAYTCYELAVNLDIQERLRQEVDETYEKTNGKLSYDVLNEMKYMDMVISESMRKNPGAILSNRVCTKPYTIQPERPNESPVHLKPGDMIWIPITALHHDEEFFPNPDKFDPERFSVENKDNIKPFSYIPFGSGPRKCLGFGFAQMEVKTLIFHILTKFEMIVIDKTIIPIKFRRDSFLPLMEGGFWIGMKRRENPVSV